MDRTGQLWNSYITRPPSPDQQNSELKNLIPRQSLKTKHGTGNLRHTYLKHTCARCGKSRSPRYQADHPLAPGEKPIRGICSRPECARYASGKGARDVLKKKPEPQIIVLEFHHYLHTSTSGNEPSSSIATAVELSGEEKTSRKELPGEYPYTASHGWTIFPTLEEQPAPRVNMLSKPTLVYC
jgi:hypothetical protein